MDLNRINTVVRPRSSWEAIDLGILMVRQWWFHLFIIWFAVTLPFFLALQVLTIFEFAYIAPLVIWWLKPIWEYGILYFASRALFGEVPQLREIFQVLRNSNKWEGFLWLTVRRFSPVRGVALPVTLLENLRGKARRQRLRVLLQEGSSTAFWLQIVCLHLEIFLEMALLVLIFLMIPTEFNNAPNLFFESLFSGEIYNLLFYNTLFYLGMSLVEPFFVVSGFLLYLNKRILLEGWDIELVFRRLYQRFHEGQKPAIAKPLLSFTLFGTMLLSSSLLVFPNASYADTPSLSSDQVASKQHIQTVLERDEFHQMETIQRWDALWDLEQNTNPSPFLNALAMVFAYGFKVILTIAFIGIVVFFIYRYRDWWSSILNIERSSSQARAMDNQHTFSPISHIETVPPNFTTLVMNLWNQGKHREALGLLYRTTLVHLTQNDAFDIHTSHTEQECKRLVKHRYPGEISDFFSLLIFHWQNLAYGHRLPDGSTMERLCTQWSQLFDCHETH